MGWIRALYWEVKMDLCSTYRYKFGVISDIVVFSIMLIFLLVSNTGKSYQEIYKYNNYKEFLLLGYIAWMYAITAITNNNKVISEELRQGIFYRKCNSKYPIQLLLFGRLISELAIQTIVIIIIVISSSVFFNVEFNINFISIVSILISTIGMYGIGLIIGGASIFFKRIGSIIFALQLGLLFITDTVPSNKSFLIFTKVLPLTSCNSIMKRSLSNLNYTNEFILLCISSIIFLIIGIGIFKIFIDKAKKKGNLLFY